ncbi:MAG: HAMP domain-containing sensor histidine kinase, partial [Spirochaetaceae bacterium]|nr:HAMP domain-containing sensor histidine kinase [Spirochaetaceae bacterium]
RPMMVLGIAGSPAKHVGSGAGAGGGMRRLVLVDWDIKASAGNEAGRIAGVAGLSLTALLMLILQQRAAIRLAVYRRDEERKARLVQLGMAARTLTHEIRNPLGIIKVQTALLKKTLGPEAAEGLEMVDGEVNRLSTLTERVREWLADPAGKPETLNAAEEITNLIARLSWEVTFVKPEETVTLKMDRSLFATTMENLIRNAVESQEGIPGASPPAVLMESDAHSVRLSVLDHGGGLPGGEKERLFDPFFTTKTQGSGVGLALSKQAVEAAGGTLTLNNRKEGGACALIILPREQS